MNQQSLWHEEPEEAMRALIDALGGPKKVGLDLYPDKPMEEARRLVLKWCDPDRQEKPSLTQLLFLLRKGRAVGCHVFAAFLLRQSGYDDPRPVEPTDELAELQRQFIKAAESQAKMLERITRLQVKVAS